ncbi:hypothetical protein SO802_026466 [Lithocarpus litseifolius]|uniref:Uncharacterized protein n=1 Tax=Lithocarpus litseifolius TaxID=425828 RepID=A0AAW2C1F8_9ROSI
MDLHELVRHLNLQAPRSCVLERKGESAHQPSASNDAAFRRGFGESKVLPEPPNPRSLQQLHLWFNPFTPPLRAKRRIAVFVIPWLLLRRTFRCRFAPPLP